MEVTSLAVQIHGGHGFIRETGVEQLMRDARITPIYEGTNGVQALDLLGRKVFGTGGKSQQMIAARMVESIAEVRLAAGTRAVRGGARQASRAVGQAHGGTRRGRDEEPRGSRRRGDRLPAHRGLHVPRLVLAGRPRASRRRSSPRTRTTISTRRSSSRRGTTSRACCRASRRTWPRRAPGASGLMALVGRPVRDRMSTSSGRPGRLPPRTGAEGRRQDRLRAARRAVDGPREPRLARDARGGRRGAARARPGSHPRVLGRDRARAPSARARARQAAGSRKARPPRPSARSASRTPGRKCSSSTASRSRRCCSRSATPRSGAVTSTRATRSRRCSSSARFPVINENDTVATAEIRYGDNDRLAARVAQMASADCLVLLSDVDGLYTADPTRRPGGALHPRGHADHAGDRGDGGRFGVRRRLGRHGHQGHGGQDRARGGLQHVHRGRPRAAPAATHRGAARAARGSSRRRRRGPCASNGSRGC